MTDYIDSLVSKRSDDPIDIRFTEMGRKYGFTIDESVPKENMSNPSFLEELRYRAIHPLKTMAISAYEAAIIGSRHRQEALHEIGESASNIFIEKIDGYIGNLDYNKNEAPLVVNYVASVIGKIIATPASFVNILYSQSRFLLWDLIGKEIFNDDNKD